MKEPSRFLEAHFALGSPLLWLGEFKASLFHLGEAHSFYNPQRHRSLILYSGHDQEVGCLTYEARAQWYLGYPDQALTCGYDALTRACDMSHPFSEARALLFVMLIHQFRGEVQRVQEQAENLLIIAREQDFALWVVTGEIMQGWALAMAGQEAGVTQIKEALRAKHVIRTVNGDSVWLALLAESHVQIGQIAGGTEVPERGVSVCG